MLSSSKVLVAGDFSFMEEFAQSSAGLFDPVAVTWKETGAMFTVRGLHAAALLLNGKVLVAGGEDGSSLMPTTFSSAEIYDPVAGTWAPTGTMNSRRS